MFKSINITPEHMGIFTEKGNEKLTVYGIKEDNTWVDITNQVDLSFKPLPFKGQGFTPESMFNVNPSNGVIAIKAGVTWGRAIVVATYPKATGEAPAQPSNELYQAIKEANAAISNVFAKAGVKDLKLEMTSLVKSVTQPEVRGVLTDSTTLTVVKIREWRALEGSIAKWPQTMLLAYYRVNGATQTWNSVPYPLSFKKDKNGNAGGLMWNVFDEDAKAGNKTYIAWAWDFLGNNTKSKNGGKPAASEGWYGMMVSTIHRLPKNTNGTERSNLIFTQK